MHMIKFYLNKVNCSILLIFIAVLIFTDPPAARAQQSGLIVDMSGVDGIELTPGNLFQYRIDNRSGQSKQVTVTGRLQFRGSRLGFSYKYSAQLQQGSNNMAANVHGVSWTWTDNALRELFQTYTKLPQGTYEYCVTVQAAGSGESPDQQQPDACVYNTVDDIFLINLMSPENDAKLHEFNPMLSWTVNYRFASELTYRLRVAELKKGQTAVAAMTRNNPIYQDGHVMTTGTVYPLTARPLEKWQPYVWAVDAYYKGILLGGSEVWKFTIVDDSVLKGTPMEMFYVDIRNEAGHASYYAIGKAKVKYVVEDKPREQLQLRLYDGKGKTIQLPQTAVQAVLGDNMIDIDLAAGNNLKHNGQYTLELTNSSGKVYRLSITYLNPDF